MEKLRLGIWRPSLKQLYNNLNNISIPAIIAGLLIVMVSVIISEIIKQGQIDRTQNLVETYADELSARIEEKLNTRFSILKLIQGYWQSDAVVTPHRFSNIAMEATKSNRRVFTDALNHAVEICRDDTKERVLSLILIDIDHFNSINDNFGHENGDTVLKAIEAEIKGSEVPNSVSCRIGGEELSLVLTHEAETDAVPIARNIQNLLYDLKLKEIENSKVTVSFGVASYEKSQPINEWHEVAGKALYHSKRNDRNRIGEAREIKNQNGK